MRKLLLVSLCASMLTGCAFSEKREIASLPIAPPPPPEPPKAALMPCVLPQIVPESTGTLSAGASLSLHVQQDTEILSCEAKRRLLVEAWPRQ